MLRPARRSRQKSRCESPGPRAPPGRGGTSYFAVATTAGAGLAGQRVSKACWLARYDATSADVTSPFCAPIVNKSVTRPGMAATAALPVGVSRKAKRVARKAMFAPYFPERVDATLAVVAGDAGAGAFTGAGDGFGVAGGFKELTKLMTSAAKAVIWPTRTVGSVPTVVAPRAVAARLSAETYLPYRTPRLVRCASENWPA